LTAKEEDIDSKRENIDSKRENDYNCSLNFCIVAAFKNKIS
jgi:hypothetical protein